MTEKIFQYSEMESYMQYYSPKTPYGLENKQEHKFYYELSELEKSYDLIESMIKYISESPQKIDQIEYHLIKIPYLEKSIESISTGSEIFNVRKFLINYKKIAGIIPVGISDLFHFPFFSDELLEKLSGDQSDEEVFYISDFYSEDLASLRSEINIIDKHLKDVKNEKILNIFEKLNLDFRFHDFLVINEELIPEEADEAVYIESYDNQSVLVKPSFGKQYYDVLNSRKDLIEKEKKIEFKIKKSLHDEINKEKNKIDEYKKNILQFDTILAKAKLAIKSNAVRPEIGQNLCINLEEAVFVPLQEQNLQKNRKYTPLTARFDQRNIVISGSNMGGKTILLKSVLFCQILAQQGFFVPSRRFSTVIFQEINLIGDINQSNNSGLSSFGEEILNLSESQSNEPLSKPCGSPNKRNTLYIVDEFARTTNSVEGKALYCALLNWFSDNGNIFSISSTHQENLPNMKDLSYWVMKGLDYGKYKQYYHKDYNCDLNERISLINNFMDYGVTPQNKSERNRDALKIADILGLNSKIIKYAEKYIKEQE